MVRQHFQSFRISKIGKPSGPTRHIIHQSRMGNAHGVWQFTIDFQTEAWESFTPNKCMELDKARWQTIQNRHL